MSAVKVKGDDLRKFRKDLKEISKEADKAARNAIKDAVDPVRRDAAQLFQPFDAKSAAGYRVAVRQRGAAVEQRLRRTTGEHPEFGVQQMNVALMPALERNADRISEEVLDMMARVAEEHGF